MYPYFLFAAIHHLKSSPTFSSRPCSSVGRVTVELFRRSWVRFPPRSKIFSLPRVVPCFPVLGLTPGGLFMGLSSTLIYTSELILCSTIDGINLFISTGLFPIYICCLFTCCKSYRNGTMSINLSFYKNISVRSLGGERRMDRKIPQGNY